VTCSQHHPPPPNLWRCSLQTCRPIENIASGDVPGINGKRNEKEIQK